MLMSNIAKGHKSFSDSVCFILFNSLSVKGAPFDLRNEYIISSAPKGIVVFLSFNFDSLLAYSALALLLRYFSDLMTAFAQVNVIF